MPESQTRLAHGCDTEIQPRATPSPTLPEGFFSTLPLFVEEKLVLVWKLPLSNVSKSPDVLKDLSAHASSGFLLSCVPDAFGICQGASSHTRLRSA